MSTLWTPGGEHPVGRPAGAGGPVPPGEPPGRPPGGPRDEPDEEALAQQLAAMRDELANAPAEVVVANHCYGLFELAALYLSQQPARLEEARLAIDALAGVVDGVAGRLGDAEAQLKDALNQLRLAYVQIDGAMRAGADVASGAATNGGSAPADGDTAPTGDGHAGGGEPGQSDPDG